MSGRHPGRHGIQGLADGFIPEIVQLDEIDEIVPIKSAAAAQAARTLALEEGLFVGISAGANFRISRFWWLYASLGYGQTTGDPFHGTPGIIAEDHINIRYAPFNLGLKYDLARSRKVHVYFGMGFEFAWIEETVPLLNENGEVYDTSSSGINKGFTWSFGPEFVVGGAGQALGLEIGGGGSKGTVTSEGHSHNVDMTGYRGRIYFVFPL